MHCVNSREAYRTRWSQPVNRSEDQTKVAYFNGCHYADNNDSLLVCSCEDEITVNVFLVIILRVIFECMISPHARLIINFFQTFFCRFPLHI